MKSLKFLIGSLFSIVIFCSCKPNDRNKFSCLEHLRDAMSLTNRNSDNPAILDSALGILNQCRDCGVSQPLVTDLKYRALLSLGRFSEARRYIDSLDKSAFSYLYKKQLFSKNAIALEFASRKNSLQRDSVYSKMAIKLSALLDSAKLEKEKFQEVFVDWAILRENLRDTISNLEIDSLVGKFPDYKEFLEFSKR